MELPPPLTQEDLIHVLEVDNSKTSFNFWFADIIPFGQIVLVGLIGTPKEVSPNFI